MNTDHEGKAPHVPAVGDPLGDLGELGRRTPLQTARALGIVMVAAGLQKICDLVQGEPAVARP